MPQKKKPLPIPPAAGIRSKRFSEQEEDLPLLADRIALAASQGRLKEFMKSEVPDNEFAEKLVSMMMGMTGMLPPEHPQSQTQPETAEGKKPDAAQPPGDLRKAADAGDVKEIMDILRREHEKRSAGSGQAPDQESHQTSSGQSDIEKQILDDLLKIAADNSVTPDWIISRALKLYVHEYRRTGRL